MNPAYEEDAAPQDDQAALQNAPIDPAPRPIDPDQDYHTLVAWVYGIALILAAAGMVGLAYWQGRLGPIWGPW